MTGTRMRVLRLLGALCLGAVAASSAIAANAENGARLARRWCASCHLVAQGQARANADAPPFATIAGLPGFSAEKIAFFLLDPHPKMPSMELTRREAEDLAAYIAGLRKN